MVSASFQISAISAKHMLCRLDYYISPTGAFPRGGDLFLRWNRSPGEKPHDDTWGGFLIYFTSTPGVCSKFQVIVNYTPSVIFVLPDVPNMFFWYYLQYYSQLVHSVTVRKLHRHPPKHHAFYPSWRHKIHSKNTTATNH